MRKKETHNIIAIYDAADEIEQITNDLRNNGIPARASMVRTLDEFTQSLNKNTWDLILSQYETDCLNIQDIIDQVKRLDKDIPVICLTSHHDPDEKERLLHSGVVDILPVNETNYFRYIIKQELYHLKERRLKRRAEIGLHEAEKRCRLLLESSRDAIAYIADGMHILANKAYVTLFGYQDGEEIAGMPILDMVHAGSLNDFKQALKQHKDSTVLNNEVSVTCLDAASDQFRAHVDLTAATFEGEDCIQIMIRKEKEADAKLHEKIKQMSKQDLVTGLSNRTHFEEELDLAIDITLHQNKTFAVFYIHLDKFLKIRAKIGVEGIDIVIHDMASILKEHFPKNSVLARFSEDTYAALWQTNDLKAAEQMGDELCKTVEDHLFDIEAQTVQLTVSVGLALLNDTVENAKSVLSRALIACHHAQEEQSGNSVFIYVKEETETQVVDQTQSVQELQKAIDDNLFKILFQPIINLRGSSTEFYEVLLRRLREDGSFESPEAFLATAEAAKVATIVDRWVILQSVKAMITRSLEGHATKIIINLTTQSLKDKTFLPWLTVALKATRLPKDCVTFQVSQKETQMHLKRVQELANELRSLHCSLSISRFETNEEAMGILKHIPVDFVKLDGQLTQDVNQSNAKTQITQRVEEIHKQGARTIATQVESASVLSVLWQIGAHYIQGYYLQPPMETMDYDFSQEE